MNLLAKKSPLYILGFPALLIVLFLFINNSHESNTELTSDFNPYLKTLPHQYINLVVQNKNQDSIYFCHIIKSAFSRELVILSTSSKDEEVNGKFAIKLFPKPNSKGGEKNPILLNIEKQATLYNYKGRTFAVYTKALPHTNFSKINIRKIDKDKKVKPWESVINSPFKLLNKTEYKTTQNDENKAIPSAYKFLYTELLKHYDIVSIPYQLEVIKDSLYNVHRDLNEYISTQNKTIGIVKDPSLFWNLINNKSEFEGSEIVFNGPDSEKASNYVKRYLNEEITLDQLVNLEKLTSYFAINNLFSKKCLSTLHFNFNTDNNKLEPFFVDSICLGGTPDLVKLVRIDNSNYTRLLVNALNEISLLDIEKTLVDSKEKHIKQQTLINDFYPKKVFDLSLLKVNQQIIRKSLNPSTAIKPELISIDNNKLVITILNLSNYPIQVNELNHQFKKIITTIKSPKQIQSKARDTLEINLPRNFENLFVSKKNKNSGFLIHKHIYELNLGYSIGELNQMHYSTIIPYQSSDIINDDLLRKKSTLNERNDIIIDSENKTISFKKLSNKISTPFIVPKGYTFVLNAGTIIDLNKGGKIISYSPLDFKGTKEKPIEISSSDRNGQGIIVFSEGRKSTVNHTNFEYLGNLKHGNWYVTGAINFYESPVELNFVTISNNKSEDALNIIRTNFSIDNCTFKNTPSDAFDGDYVKGIIKGSVFINLGNDAIDVSGSDIEINNVQISKAGDKGISAGENSKMIIKNVSVTDSEIGFASKDLSKINASDIRIKNTKLAFTAFQKKPEFGPSQITLTRAKMENVELNYLIEDTSSLLIDGEKVETSQNVKDRMYGVEFGVSSDETKNEPSKN